MQNTTIAAISTAIGTGGIGVIRISGPDAFKITDKIYRAKNKIAVEHMKSHTVSFGSIIDHDKDRLIDEVLVTKFESPKSFTGENTVEISCHGGILLTKMILDLILQNGACSALPGEFSKRAFLNGKMDLSKAEAVIEMISAKSEASVYNNAFIMAGGLLDRVSEIRQRAIDLTASILAKVEFPDEDIDGLFVDDVIHELEQIKTELTELKESYKTGKILSQGVKLAIVGRPNVGKSSLLNRLLRENRAIVTDIEGTTRDTIEEYATIQGILFKIIDTAGIRETADEIEKIGVKKANEAIYNADIVYFLEDVSKERQEEDFTIEALLKGKKVVHVLNKADLGVEGEREGILISTKTGLGLEELEEKTVSLVEFSGLEVGSKPLLTSLRQKESIEHALTHLEEALYAARHKVDLDLVTIDIEEVISDLGEVTGKTVSDEVIDTIFSRFCLGK